MAVATIVAMANPIDRTAAMQKAKSFMQGVNPQAQLQTPATPRKAMGNNGSAPYYIFNAENNKGFVIVSGDDRTPDILGYADTHGGKYPTRPSDDLLTTAVCNIAVCEHLRWNATMQLQGYSHGTVKNHLCRTHPCLTGWDDLTYEKQAYDFLALETVFSMIVHDANKA